MERNDEELTRLINFFSGQFYEAITELILELNIKIPEDFLYVPKRKIKAKRGVGEYSILQFKRVLLNEFGVKYDSDSSEDIDKKINQRKNKEGLLSLRFTVLQRDGFRCQYCGRSPKNNAYVILQIDHMHPESRGGVFTEDNLITSCQECNLGKSDIILKSRSTQDE